MKRILVEIYLPATLHSYDVQIPADVPLYQVTTLVAAALAQMSNNQYTSDYSPVLCDRERGEIFNINMTASELGLRNGSSLMLI